MASGLTPFVTWGISFLSVGGAMQKTISLLIVFFLLTACAKVYVQPVAEHHGLSDVCIQRNEKVVVEDFLPVVIDGLKRHGISSTVFNDQVPDDCDAILSYTARRSWAFTPFLAHAELRLHGDNVLIAEAVYHLNAKGGLHLTKWKSVKSKMDPVIDELLKNYASPTKSE